MFSRREHRSRREARQYAEKTGATVLDDGWTTQIRSDAQADDVRLSVTVSDRQVIVSGGCGTTRVYIEGQSELTSLNGIYDIPDSGGLVVVSDDCSKQEWRGWIPPVYDAFEYYYLGLSPEGSGRFPPYLGFDLAAYLAGRGHYFNNIQFRVARAGEIRFFVSDGVEARDYTGIGAGTIIDTGPLYPSGGTPPKIDVYLGPGAQVEYLAVDGVLQ